MFIIMSVCVDGEDQLDDMAWLRRRKKRAVSLGGGLPRTMSSHILYIHTHSHTRELYLATQCMWCS